MNSSTVTTRCILLFVLVAVTGIQSRSLKKRSGSANQCAPKKVIIEVAVPTCHKRDDVPVKKCMGTCDSYTVPSSSGSGVVTVCDCCRILDEEILSVQLKCIGTNGEEVFKFHDVISALSCQCLSCL